MAIEYRRTRKVGANTRLNVTHRGVGLSRKVGPLAVSTRGNVSVKLGKGLYWRKRGRAGKDLAVLLIILGIVAGVVALSARLLWAAMLWAWALTVWLARWAWFGSVWLVARVRGEQPVFTTTDELAPPADDARVDLPPPPPPG